MQLGQNEYEVDSAGGGDVKQKRATPRAGARQRVPHATQPRARRTSHRDGADLDQLYLSEMAHAHVLTPQQETEIAQSIVAAERGVIAAVLEAPTGRATLVRLGDDLAKGEVDVRDVVLNPDQEGLDLAGLRERVVHTFGALTGEPKKDELERAVDRLTEIRLDAAVLDGVVAALRASGDERDRECARAFDRARRELRRSKERLVVGNLRLVLLFARKYLGRGVPLLDLVQEGNLGLMRAADKFDHRRGFRFNTYAAWWIRQALQRALLDRTLRLPVHVADDRRRIGKVRAVFSAQHRREPTPEEIAGMTGLGRDRIDNILSLPSQPASLDAPIGEEGDASLVDLVAGKETAPDEAASLRALGADLQDLLGGLTPREQQVLRMRFGMGKEREHTLEEVGRELSLTRERIRQIERAALAKLRQRSERLDLASYL